MLNFLNLGYHKRNKVIFVDFNLNHFEFFYNFSRRLFIESNAYRKSDIRYYQQMLGIVNIYAFIISSLCIFQYLVIKEPEITGCGGGYSLKYFLHVYCFCYFKQVSLSKFKILGTFQKRKNVTKLENCYICLIRL